MEVRKHTSKQLKSHKGKKYFELNENENIIIKIYDISPSTYRQIYSSNCIHVKSLKSQYSKLPLEKTKKEEKTAKLILQGQNYSDIKTKDTTRKL